MCGWVLIYPSVLLTHCLLWFYAGSWLRVLGLGLVCEPSTTSRWLLEDLHSLSEHLVNLLALLSQVGSALLWSWAGNQAVLGHEMALMTWWLPLIPQS